MTTPTRPTFAQIGQLLALQEAAGVASTIPNTEQEAQEMIDALQRELTRKGTSQ